MKSSNPSTKSETTSFWPLKNNSSSSLRNSYHILRTSGVIPAGVYRIYLSVTPDSAATFQKDFLLQADSTLPATSSLNRQLNNHLLPRQKTGLFGNALQTTASSIPASKTLAGNSKKISRLFHSRGLTPQTEEREGKARVNLWYEDWFVGRYELDAAHSAASQIGAQKARIAGNVSSFATNDLTSYRSLFAQVRELAKADREENELSGELALSGNFSNGQPEYSAQDNNYYELWGRTETEVADIPVSVEGYYTSQDAHRQIKGSYVRVHYDADKAKQKLIKLISGYQNQFSQTVAKGKGLEQVYGSYLSNLQGSKDRMVHDIIREAGLPSASASGSGGASVLSA